MNHGEAIAGLRALLEEHNKNLPDDVKVDVDTAMKKLMVEGGTTMAGLQELDVADLKVVGFPTGCAKVAVKLLSGASGTPASASAMTPPSPTPVFKLNVSDIATELSEATDADLINRLNPDEPGRVGDELDRRARGAAFLGFRQDGTVDVAASAARLTALRKNQRVGETMTVDGHPVRPRRIGQAARPQRSRVNPLFPEETLIQPELECSVTCESWTGVADEVCQILIIEATRPGGRPWGKNVEAARSVIEMARRPNAAAEVRRRYKLAAVAYDEMQPNERPALERADDVYPQGAGRGLPFAAEAWDPWAGARPGAKRVVVLAAPADRRIAVELDQSLAMLRRSGVIDTFLTVKADPEHEDEPLQRIAGADMVLVVVSADLFADDVQHMLEACRTGYEAGRLRVIPVFARACDVNFSDDPSVRTGLWLERLRCFPADAKPLAGRPQRDSLLADLAREVREIARSTATRDAAGSSVYRAAVASPRHDPTGRCIFDHSCMYVAPERCGACGRP